MAADPKPAPAADALATLLAAPVKCCGCGCHRDERVLELLSSLRTERDAAVEKNRRTLDTPRTLSCGHTYTLRTTACPSCFAELKAELATARETNTRLNRRAQAYEAAIREKIEAGAADRRTLGRILANGAAEMYRHHAEVMQKALVGCAVILESLAASVKWELAPEIMDDIRRALPGAREAVAHAPTLAHLTGLEERAKAAEAEVQRLTREQDEAFAAVPGHPILPAASLAENIRLLAAKAAADESLKKAARLATLDAQHHRMLREETQKANASLRERLEAAESREAALRGERDEACEALGAMSDGADRAGGDGYGMPECPWCGRQDDGDDAQPVTDRHDADCELLASRSVLARIRKEDR